MQAVAKRKRSNVNCELLVSLSTKERRMNMADEIIIIGPDGVVVLDEEEDNVRIEK